MGDDEDQPDRPAQIANRKDVIKRKKSKKTIKVKQTQEIIDTAKPAHNEVDGTLNSGEVPLSDETVNLASSGEENVSAVGANSASIEDPEDDEEESEEEGILGEICMLV